MAADSGGQSSSPHHLQLPSPGSAPNTGGGCWGWPYWDHGSCRQGPIYLAVGAPARVCIPMTVGPASGGLPGSCGGSLWGSSRLVGSRLGSSRLVGSLLGSSRLVGVTAGVFAAHVAVLRGSVAVAARVIPARPVVHSPTDLP